MAIEAVIFDWGGTLSSFVSAELVDAWRLAARHLAPDREDEVTAALVAVEEEFWATTATHQRSTTLGDLMAAASARLGLDVAEALLEEAAVRHLDAWTEHVVHDPAAAPTLRALDVEQPGGAVFVGDRLWDDVFGARQTGMHTVLRRNRHVPVYDVEPDAVIDELPELIAVVDGWG